MFMLLHGFATFSMASGLMANQGKSEIYAGSVDNDIMGRIMQASGFRMGKLPFKYLGVPISSQRLIVADCDILAEKIISRIRMWGSKNMSYTARTMLVNSFLLSLHTYWVLFLLFPKLL